MGEINLANSSGRDAAVATASVSGQRQVRWLDERGRQASSRRIIKSTLPHSLEAILEQQRASQQANDQAEEAQDEGDLEAVAQLLIDGDPEIDLEQTGRFLRESNRVYVDKHRGIVRNVKFWEVIKNADGTVRERRPRQLADTNISSDTPLRWTGKFIAKEKAVRKFVFSSKVQIQHVNGLTYDFLFAMAKDLEERKSLMLLGAGPKSSAPLIMRRGGTPYRGFLEGRTQGDKYCLLLHFSNLEMKTPKAEQAEEA